jgi:4-hydroxy-tetrahydrodipicolinate synthase
MIENFGKDGFDVFPASESLLSKGLAIGAAGCISATVNMNPAGIHALYAAWNTAQGPALQADADVIRNIFQALAMIAAMKRVVAEFSCGPIWKTVRPPLCALDDASADKVLAALREARFAMPGYPGR